MLKVMSIKANLKSNELVSLEMLGEFVSQGPAFKGILEVVINDFTKNLVLLKSGSDSRQDTTPYNIDVTLYEEKKINSTKKTYRVDYVCCSHLESLNKQEQHKILELIIAQLRVNKVMVNH